MANRKKKKTPPKPRFIHVVTKSFFDQYSLSARKLLQQFGFDPDLFDQFSKKQKLKMMMVQMLPPKVSVKYGHSVPRQYVNYIKLEVHNYLKGYFGDASLKMTYEEFVTTGLSFISYVTRLNDKQGDIASEFVRNFSTLIAELEKEDYLIVSLLEFVQNQLFEISKINIRLYGVMWGFEIESPKSVAGHLYLTAAAPECVNFTWHNKVRPAYRLGNGNLNELTPFWVTVPRNSVVPGSFDESPLNIYVQNHALMRIKERLDTLIPYNRNAAIMFSLLDFKIVKAKTGRILCTFIDAKNQLLGYLPFTIEGDKLFVLSFIPLSCPTVPEGSRLCKILNITKEDMEFLGMDKLSFYQNTDFDAIPNLKAALIEAGLWHLTEIEPEETIKDRPLVKSTGVIAKFFQEIKPESNNEDILSEVAKMYD